MHLFVSRILSTLRVKTEKERKEGSYCFTHSVALSKLFDFCVPQFPLLYTKDGLVMRWSMSLKDAGTSVTWVHPEPSHPAFLYAESCARPVTHPRGYICFSSGSSCEAPYKMLREQTCFGGCEHPASNPAAHMRK